jgi:hypothetical protein
VVSGIPAVTTSTRAFSFGYTQAFSTGLSISASYGVNRQKSTQLHLLYNPYYTPGFNVSVAQQLLNGFGRAVNLALIHVAENELNIERESFRATAVAAIAAAQNAYWDLIAAKEAVLAAEEEVKAAEQLVENNRKEFEAGVMSRLDIATAESQAASSRRDLIVATSRTPSSSSKPCSARIWTSRWPRPQSRPWTPSPSSTSAPCRSWRKRSRSRGKTARRCPSPKATSKASATCSRLCATPCCRA